MLANLFGFNCHNILITLFFNFICTATYCYLSVIYMPNFHCARLIFSTYLYAIKTTVSLSWQTEWYKLSLKHGIFCFYTTYCSLPVVQELLCCSMVQDSLLILFDTINLIKVIYIYLVQNKYRKMPALFLGPAENRHVPKYEMVLKQFPMSFKKQPWSDAEKDKLARGIKQQYQETLILDSLNNGR